MNDLMRERVEERLDTLRITPAEAERRGELRPGYIREFLSGKKKTMRDGGLEKAAVGLNCDPEYLLGQQNTPRKNAEALGGAAISIHVAGTIESGAWREPEATDAPGDTLLLTVAPGHQYSPERLAAYWVRGDHAAGLGISSNEVVTVLLGASGTGYHDGDIVVLKRTNAAGNIELSIRIMAAGELQARPASPNSIPAIAVDEGEIVGLVISATKLFGSSIH